MKKTLLATALISGIFSQAAMADSNFYLGGGVGKTSVDYVEVTGATVTDDSDTSWKIFGGYNFNKNFAVEFAYQDLGENSADVLNVPVKIEGDAYSVALLGKLPVGEKAEFFAKLGYAHIDADADINNLASVSEDDSDVLYGLGANYSVTEKVDLRLEWERMDFEDEVDTVSLGVIYNF
ncbi:porin family protein [Neptuniibacter sp. QD48_55]|uniref:porin family protein n=1 Tax=Neptuniibacter sp. QD48_55 TaxID=3398212 RepID=UPI0039F5DBC7